MSRMFMLIGCLFLLTALLGCAGSPVTVPLPAGGLPVQARLQLEGYRLQALLTAYTPADIDHVRLSLMRRVDGAYQPTGATFTLANGELGQPIALGQLKLNSDYRILAEAYTAAEESDATRISDPAGSTTDFQTPAIAPVAGVDTIDLAPVSLISLSLKLTDKVYAGSADFVVAFSKNLERKTASVAITLLAGADEVYRKTYSLDEILLGQTYALQNLRLATSYTLQADALDASGTVLSTSRSSTVAFATPDAAGGSVDDVVSGTPFTLPCK